MSLVETLLIKELVNYPAHNDIVHGENVRKNTIKILDTLAYKNIIAGLSKEREVKVLAMASLLHFMHMKKQGLDEKIKVVQSLLLSNGFSLEETNYIFDLIYVNRKSDKHDRLYEARCILFDANLLDSLGARGIERALAKEAANKTDAANVKSNVIKRLEERATQTQKLTTEAAKLISRTELRTQLEYATKR